MADDEVARWTSEREGQFFERKSAHERNSGRQGRRKAADIARDIAETLAAMANADGGELVVGLEDDGTVTGVPHPADKLSLLVNVPRDRNYVQPVLPASAREVHTANGDTLLHYVVEWSPEVHRLTDGRYMLRVKDSNMPFAAEQIAALKATKGQGLFERGLHPGTSLNDLDLDLVVSMVQRLGSDNGPEETLRRYRLIEGRNGHAVPSMAALLLFGKDPLKWHPRCGIDFVRWDGTERKHGSELNIAKRIRIEHPLAVLIEKTYESILPYIRERQQLHDLLFTERLEYPTFVWQEAIVNAVAHRDYSIQGASIEVWMFDDRIEIRSPGIPPAPATTAALNRREHLHISRNPLLVRVLADLGYMRELGEGIPRMFSIMEEKGFYPPKFEDIGGAALQVTLRNQPVYDPATVEWLSGFKDLNLSGNQKRLLAYARAHGDRFTNREYQKLAGLDIYGASNSIKDLMRKGAVRLTSRRSRIYEVLEPLKTNQNVPPELVRLLPVLKRKGEISNEDVRVALVISRAAATRLVSELCRAGWLERIGSGRWTRYRRASRPMHQSHYASDTAETDA